MYDSGSNHETMRPDAQESIQIRVSGESVSSPLDCQRCVRLASLLVLLDLQGRAMSYGDATAMSVSTLLGKIFAARLWAMTIRRT